MHVVQMKHARELKRNHQDVIPKDTTERELFKKSGRYVALQRVAVPETIGGTPGSVQCSICAATAR